MAGEFAKFYIRLGTLFDPKGLEEAKNHINQTDDSASNLKSTFTKIGGLFAGGAAIYKLGSGTVPILISVAKTFEADIIKISTIILSIDFLMTLSSR